MYPPVQPERTFGHYLGIRPSVVYCLQPVGQVFVVADRYLPDACYPAETVESVAAVEVHRGGIHHLFAADHLPQVANGFNRAYAHAAVESALKAVAPRCEKIAGPAVEADTVDEVRWTLGGFEIVLAARVIGIADASVAIAVVDRVLAPDLALAYMNALFCS